VLLGFDLSQLIVVALIMPSLLVPSRTTVYPQSGRLDRFRTSPLRRDAML